MTGQQTDQQTDQRLELLPAVDISGGQAVQLVQGVAGSGGAFGDPWEAAQAWQDAGAESVGTSLTGSACPPRRGPRAA